MSQENSVLQLPGNIVTFFRDPIKRNTFLERSSIYLILIILFIVASIASPVFIKVRNILNVIRLASILGIVSVGQTFVILGGGIDLSVASVMALMSILSANMMEGQNELVLPIFLLCLAIAALIGLGNGLLVAKIKIPPFIATLGMLLMVQGFRFIYSGGMPKGSIPENLRFLGRDLFLKIPVATWLCVLIGFIAWIILNRTTLGRSVYAVGGNRKCAYLSGMKVERIQITTYVISSFWAGFAGLLLTGWIGLADNWLGQGYELDSIAAVVIGGSVLTGGKGSVWGSLAGSLMLAILYNLVILLGLDVEMQRIVKGLVIISAVALYRRLSLG
jgi:ribose/xylose/arabinose/galactoside ABC-type transport system permease subunit